jgi:hypothetical protein
MSPLTFSSRLRLALALLIPGLLVLWLVAVPGMLTASSYLVVAGVTIALAGIGLITYRNAQPTSSIAHVLHEADIAAPAASAVRGPSMQEPKA